MQLLAASAHRRMPWKNGGGETIEIAAHPAGAGLADFDWRVSMARVEGDGPFSVFPGIDRTLCILDGEGLELDVEGLGRRRLTLACAPFAFPADAPTGALLLGGPITDLNVMSRRGALSHRVERIDIAAGGEAAVAPRPARWSLLLANGACRVEGAGAPRAMADRDALLAEGSLPALRAYAPQAPASLFVVTIAP
ncbi:HutD family protein [Aureimonas flava]|uniref:HutD family protein n=1 Tax=Aureimonas flava TaxID=2320271 RepID=A0A3A1WP36_9HYPH|nr:HutD family protein [Aureimonas flava]RIX97748.1 HutD family protein [Aureimonas flava]